MADRSVLKMWTLLIKHKMVSISKYLMTLIWILGGEKVGIVGRSGAGKSTLVNLLLRFYDIQSGTIAVDGQAVTELQQESLRAKISMVTQDTSLMHRSVRDNVIYGEDASERYDSSIEAS